MALSPKNAVTFIHDQYTRSTATILTRFVPCPLVLRGHDVVRFLCLCQAQPLLMTGPDTAAQIREAVREGGLQVLTLLPVAVRQVLGTLGNTAAVLSLQALDGGET